MKERYTNARKKFKNRNQEYWPIELEEKNKHDGEKGGNRALMKDFASNTVRVLVLIPEFRNLYKDVKDTQKYDWEKMDNLKKLYYEEAELTVDDIGLDDIWLYEKLTGMNTSIEISLLMDLLLDGRDIKAEGNVKRLLQDLVKEIMVWPGSYSRKQIVHILIYLAKSIKDEGGEINIEVFLKYCIMFLKDKMPIFTKEYDNILCLIWQYIEESNVEISDFLSKYSRKENSIGLDGIGCICNSQEDIFLTSADTDEKCFKVFDKAKEIRGNSLNRPKNSLWFQVIQKEVIKNR